MSTDFHTFGENIPSLDSEQLNYAESKHLLNACNNKFGFDVVELGKLNLNGSNVDLIIVDCGDGTIASKNNAHINVQERLALVYCPSRVYPYEVRTLRKEFPVKTPHLNHVLHGEPCSLCLYFEPWSSVERTWTPENFLDRILWWLRETSNGTLHKKDQPLEPPYFESQFQLIIPSDFYHISKNINKMLGLELLNVTSNKKHIYIGTYHEKDTSKIGHPIECLTVTINPLVSNAVFPLPYNFEELSNQLKDGGSELFKSLGQSIKNVVNSDGIKIPNNKDNYIFIVLKIPLKRSKSTEPEQEHLLGFIAHTSIANLGIDLGVLYKNIDEPIAYKENAIGGFQAPIDEKSLRKVDAVRLEPLSIKLRKDPDFFRKASGISGYTEINGILAGVGSLGGNLAQLWSKEQWGIWTYIDDDILETHNPTRHIASDLHIGYSKTKVVKKITDSNLEDKYANTKTIELKVNKEDVELIKSLESGDLIVDATTTLDAPRDLSLLPNLPRMVSVFITPSGNDSVMLFEDKNKELRLSTLEPQYYRGILNNKWGEKHLQGHAGDLWVGAGCRDSSVIMSFEDIQLHSAILAKQIRLKYQDDKANIQIWVTNNNSEVNAHSIPVSPSKIYQCGSWSIVWDEALTEKIKRFRIKELPNETGGILLGYSDQKTSTIYIVDIVPAPSDSEASPKGFLRGTNGLKELIKICSSKTAGIVNYIGEWHSHPKYASTQKSDLDIKQLSYLASEMAFEGQQALMVIIGDKDISLNINQDSSVLLFKKE